MIDFLTWFKQNEGEFKEQGIVTDEVFDAESDSPNDPRVTIHQVFSDKRMGVIYIWETNDIIFEVLDVHSGDTIFYKKSQVNSTSELTEVCKNYIIAMRG